MENDTGSTDRIQSEAKRSIGQGGEVRERMRNLTVRALRQRSLRLKEIRSVVRAMTEGMAQGAPGTADLKRSLAEAFSGIDQALMKSAEASQLALKELAARGTEFQETELREALEHLKQLEEDFLSTVSQVAQKSEQRVKTALEDLVTHARRTGTDTGAKTAEAVAAASASFGSLMVDSARSGMHIARETSGRFVELASGIFAGMADALRDESATAGPRPAARDDKAGAERR